MAWSCCVDVVLSRCDVIMLCVLVLCCCSVVVLQCCCVAVLLCCRVALSCVVML